jgi:hypothetical protein
VNIRIDRLRVQIAGMNPDTARQFGRLLAEHLAAAMAAAPPDPAAPPGPDSASRLTTLRVSVPGPTGRNPRGLALAAAAGVSRALRTAATGTGPAVQPTVHQGTAP